MKEFEEKTGIRFTWSHTAKMDGFYSLSTACTINPLCIERAKIQKSICSKCYSMSMNKKTMYSKMRAKLERNAEILTSGILNDDEMPRLMSPCGLFRFEAFGDLINEIQVVNYFRIASANPKMPCALWTKNPWIIERSMKEYGIKKPANLQILASSYMMNECMTEFLDKYDFIDKLFTVYDKKTIETENIKINCGGRKCAECRKCYGKNKCQFINEKLK